MFYNTVTFNSASDDVTVMTSFSPTLNTLPDVVEEHVEAKNPTSMAPTLAYLAVLAAVGIVGNSLVFLVYYKRFKASATKTYVQTLSALDLTTNVCCLSMEIPKYAYNHSFTSVECKVTTSLMAFLVCFSGSVLVAVALDRRQTVCRRQGRSLMSVKKARRAVLVSGTLSFVLNAPRVHLAESRTTNFTGSNITTEICSALNPKQSEFASVYSGIFIAVLVVAIVTLIVCYSAIAWHLWQHRKRRALQSGPRPVDTMETTFTSDTVDTDKLSKTHVHSVVHTDGACANIPSHIRTDIRKDVPSDVQIDGPSDIHTGIRSDVHTDGPSDGTSDVHIGILSDVPTDGPSDGPTDGPTDALTGILSDVHTDGPTNGTSDVLTGILSDVHTDGPSDGTSDVHTDGPSDVHTDGPSDVHIDGPSNVPTDSTSDVHIDGPSNVPTDNTSNVHTGILSAVHTDGHCNVHADVPSNVHTDGPSDVDIGVHTNMPSNVHTDVPSDVDIGVHTNVPSNVHTDDHTEIHTDVHAKTRLQVEDIQPAPTQTKPSHFGPQRKKIPSHLTLMFFVLTAICVLSFVPRYSLVLMTEESQDGFDPNALEIMRRSFYLNSVINPFVYSFFSAKFRLECRRMFSGS